MSKQEKFFQVGTVIGVHGVRGYLKVRPETEGSQSLVDASILLIEGLEGRKQFRPVKVKFHKGNHLVLLEGIASCEQAEAMRGSSVLMPFEELPDLSEGEHYWHQIENFEVVDESHGSLGSLKALIATGAHDLYEVHGSFGEILIPVVDGIVKKVDVAAGIIYVDLPDGLLGLTGEN